VGYWGWRCAGDLDNPERFGFLLDGGTKMNANEGEVPPPPQCLTALFAARCGKAGCHVADTQQIDLVSPKVEDRLVDQKSTSTQCKDHVLVASDGTESLLLKKVDGVPPCGLPMPLGEKLSVAEVKCVSDWVSAVSDAKGGGS
jgi:hypothetical protein